MLSECQTCVEHMQRHGWTVVPFNFALNTSVAFLVHLCTDDLAAFIQPRNFAKKSKKGKKRGLCALTVCALECSETMEKCLKRILLALTVALWEFHEIFYNQCALSHILTLCNLLKVCTLTSLLYPAGIYSPWYGKVVPKGPRKQ